MRADRPPRTVQVIVIAFAVVEAVLLGIMIHSMVR
jgi:hypothetical protein